MTKKKPATKKSPAVNWSAIREGHLAPVRTQIRLPAELHTRLQCAAATNRRSLNAEMLVRLEETLNQGR